LPGGGVVGLQQTSYDCNRRRFIAKGNVLKLHLADPGAQNLCTAYGEGFVAVNQRRIETNLIILPEQLIEPWQAVSFETLLETDFIFLAGLPTDVLLLGTGRRLRFPHPRLAEPLRRAHIGFEVMDTPAACRTYNILVGESRRVAAALFIG